MQTRDVVEGLHNPRLPPSLPLMRPRRPKNYCLQLDIALWHTKLCFHVQIEHSSRIIAAALAHGH